MWLSNAHVVCLSWKARFLATRWSGGGHRSLALSARNPSATRLAALTVPSKNNKYVLAMVGLPARGKSYIVQMIIRYLRWTGIPAQLFNVGNYRRKLGMAAIGANFFDAKNEAAQAQREQLAVLAQDDLYEWLHAQQGICL